MCMTNQHPKTLYFICILVSHLGVDWKYKAICKHQWMIQWMTKDCERTEKLWKLLAWNTKDEGTGTNKYSNVGFLLSKCSVCTSHICIFDFKVGTSFSSELYANPIEYEASDFIEVSMWCPDPKGGNQYKAGKKTTTTATIYTNLTDSNPISTQKLKTLIVWSQSYAISSRHWATGASAIDHRKLFNDLSLLHLQIDWCFEQWPIRKSNIP